MSSKRAIKTTEQELAYRDKHFHDIRVVKDRQIICASCGNVLNIETTKIFSHPLIGVLQCETCWKNFKQTDVTSDEDENEKYCYICGSNKKLYICGNKDCTSAFCKICIKRNVNLSLLDAEREDWKCFICKPKPFWELRAVCAAVIAAKRGNRKSIQQIKKRILPSQKEQMVKNKEIQKTLKKLCDKEDSSSDERSSFGKIPVKESNNKDRYAIRGSTIARQREAVEISILDSSSMSESEEESKQRKIKNDQKAKSCSWDSSSKRTSHTKLMKQKSASKKNEIYSDSDNDSVVIDIKSRRTLSNVKAGKLKSRKPVTSSSDSESNVSSMSKVSNTSKSLPKHVTRQNKKKNDSSRSNTKSAKGKTRNHCDSSSESEDEDIEYKKQGRKKYSNSNASSNKEESKCDKRDKLTNKNLSQKMQKALDSERKDSDSSSKEFQKEKLLRNKYSSVNRQLKDLDIDYTKSPCAENSVNGKSKPAKDVEEQSNLNFNNMKELWSECKSICFNFQKSIESIEQLYGREDDEKLLLKFTNKINKLRTVLDQKQKDVTNFHKSWSKGAKGKRNTARRSCKEVSDDEQSSLEESSTHKEHNYADKKKTVKPDSPTESRRESKQVSECDSEEIFSADEMRSPRKMETTRNISTMENHSDNNNDEDSQDDLTASPVLGVSKEKKASAEQSSKKQDISEFTNNNSHDNETQSMDENIKPQENNEVALSSIDIYVHEIEIEAPPVKEVNERATLENNERDDSASSKDIINESMDMFVDMFETFEAAVNIMDETNVAETNVEISGDQLESSKIGLSDRVDALETSLQDEADRTTPDDKDNISEERDRTSSSHCNKDEWDLSSEDDQGTATTSNEKKHDGNDLDKVDASERACADDAEYLEEAMAKKVLLESESDNDARDNASSSVNVSKQTEKSNVDELGSKESEVEDDDTDSRSSTTVSLSTIMKKKNADKNAEETRNERSGKSDEINSRDGINSSDESEDTKAEEALLESNSEEDESARAEEDAKKALLESDESIIASTPAPKKTAKRDKTKSSATVANTKAKKALLASSSSSDDSCSESAASSEMETRISKSLSSVKRTRESESDSLIISTMKKRRLKLNKNYYYMNDKKLRMSCEVHVTRLSKRVLSRYSRALQKSRQYLEHKALKSLVNLDKLEKRCKRSTKKDSDASTDDNDASSKILQKSSKKNGKQATKETEESLMDHLKKVENDDLSTVEMDYNSDDSVHRVTKEDSTLVSNEALISEANKAAKQSLLNSSDSDIEKEVVLDSDGSINNDDKNKKTEDKKKKSSKKTEEKISKQDEDKKEKSGKSNWRRNKILTMKFSDTDSDAEKEKWEKKQEKLKKEKEENSGSDDKEKNSKPKKKKKKKKTARRILDSDSDIKLTDCDSDSSSSMSSSVKQKSSGSDDTKKKKEKQKRKKRKHGNSTSSDTSFEEKKPKPKRKRIKKMATDSDSSDEMKVSQGTPGKSGRKNIRKVLKDKQVADDTKQAAKEEEERLKRIAERQAVYNEMYEIRLAGEEKVDKLILDFNTETKEELVSVHEQLVKRLKPHQAQGIKFMWDACFESLERIKTTSGSGCIIAHCMGLGKTLQVIALTHALLTHEATGVKTVLIVCPLSTVLNWVHEYKTWLKDLDDDVEIYELTKYKKNFERKYQLQRWQETGGVLIIGYEMFRNLTGANKNIRKAMKEAILECLINPGADLVVCDEGHLLKNEDTALSKCMRMVTTLRRIVLTGTPLQNNLIEYHCMVQFVKPNLLGTKKEFLNRFVNPIMNGQFDDSTAYDVKLMKKRAHVLHKMLEGSVQRFDYSVLTPFLPPKQEYVMFIRLTETQIKMYEYYLANLARRHHGVGGSLFADFQALQRIWTHPIVLRLNAEKIANEKKGLSSDTEGSLKDFINDDTTDIDTTSSESQSDNDVQAVDEVNIPKRKTRNNPGVEEEPEPPKEEVPEATKWWAQFVEPEHFEDMRVSSKLLLLFAILKECGQIGDKVLVFSQSLYSLTLIEEFLRRIDDETQNDQLLDTLDNHTGSWSLGLDYFRLDGNTSAENRSAWCKIFNRPTNTRARLFLISTRAGGLGINLTAANRVIIFDASWNPSHDVQSIFRIYRFGQKKPCYVYRFLAAGTMEEKIYNRQVTKLSLSCRVVDEQQIERHYSNHDLNELYMFEPYNKEKPTLNLPKDRLLAEIFLKYKDSVENYHEHDSLLENKAEEELDEEERKQAWLEYEEEKKGKPPMMMAYQNNMFLQQCNMMMNSEQSSMISPNMSLQLEYENLQQLIRKDYPNATLEQQKLMTTQALMEMYNYWERQAVLQPARNALPNFQPRQHTIPYATNSNMHVNTQQVSQLNQLLTGQPGNYMNMNQSVNQANIASLVPNLFTYRNVPTNNTEKTTDIVEVISPNNMDSANAQIATQSTATNKNQEE